MDLGTIGGIVAGLVLIVWSIVVGGVSVMAFVDAPSVIIVFGGMTAALFVSYPIGKVLGIGKVFQKTLKTGGISPIEIIKKIIDLANIARREGLLALEEAVDQVNDDFLKKGVMLIVDGTDPELVKNILETEISYMEARHGEGKGMLDTLGSLGPAFGMIGTLIGLVAMLKNLSDPSSIGPSMAVALITTFYGSVVANLMFIPMANKVSLITKEEVLVREIMVEGLLSIQAGENPRIIEEKLKAFLPPNIRKAAGTQEGAEDKA